MADPKTKLNDASVDKFLEKVEDPAKREDCYTVLDIMKKITRAEPKMWGTSIIGFGSYHYKYANGREGDWPISGFSPRKQNLTLYIMSGFKEYDALLKKLGKHKTGKSCLYIKSLEDIDLKVLREIIKKSVKKMSELKK